MCMHTNNQFGVIFLSFNSFSFKTTEFQLQYMLEIGDKVSVCFLHTFVYKYYKSERLISLFFYSIRVEEAKRACLAFFHLFGFYFLLKK